MKKLLILFLVFVFVACQTRLDDDLSQLQELKSASLYSNGVKAQAYDKFVVKFAKSLSKAMADNDFRQLIKSHAMQQIDGDYDIIWKTFKDKVHGVSGKKVSQIITENLEGLSNEEKLNELDMFGAEFKKFQISVPVNCEKWNTNEQRPIVAYMLSNYDDENEFIYAFDENGMKTTMSLKSVPDFPVIVVGLNERSDEEGEIKAEYNMLQSQIIDPGDPGEPIPPAAPTELVASQVPSGIFLSWKRPTIISGITGYVIERKGPGQIDFVEQYTTSGASNTVFTDISITPGATYSYRIRSWNWQTELMSEGSTNIASATAPFSPNPPSSFTVEHVVQNEAKMNWINSNNQSLLENRIYRYSHTSGSNYVLIATLPPSSTYYFDRSVTPGRYDYLIRHYNNQGESSGIKDFVHIPYRNIQGTNPIYIKNISFTNWDLERWPAGKPEFRINVFNVDRSSKSTFNIVNNVDFNFPSETSSCNFSNRLIINWNQDIWYDVLSLSMVEYDEQWGPNKITVSASIKTKVGQNLEVGVGTALEWDITDDYENCGVVYIDFYERPEITYSFQNYGAKITISEYPN